MIVLWNFRN